MEELTFWIFLEFLGFFVFVFVDYKTIADIAVDLLVDYKIKQLQKNHEP